MLIDVMFADEKNRDKAQGGQSSAATSEKDPNDGQKKIKEEFPESPPGPVIGMQDEKGRKGV